MRPRLILLVLMAVVVVVLAQALYTREAPAESAMVGLTAAVFLLAIQSRYWLVLPLLVVQMSVQSYMILVGEIGRAGLSLNLAVTLVASLAALPVLLRSAPEFLADSAFRRVFLPALALVSVATIVNSIVSDFNYVFQEFRFQFTQFMVLVLIACLIGARHQLKALAIAALGLGAISALAAIIQLRAMNVGRHLTISRFYEDLVQDDRRAIGLSMSAPNATYDFVFVLAPLIGFLAAYGVLRLDRTRAVLCGAAVALASGVYFTGTRSGMFAIAAALAVTALFVPARLRAVILGTLVVAAIVFQLNPESFGKRFDSDEQGQFTDESAVGHQAMWQVAWAVAMDNPIFGVGSEHWENVSTNYVDFVLVSEDDRVQAHAEGAVGTNSPHNDFLGSWGFWGIGGFLALLGLFWGTFINCIRAVRSEDRLIRGLAVGVVAGLAAYATNALFHNVTTTSAHLWMYAGVSVLLARWAQVPRGAAKASPPEPLLSRRRGPGPRSRRPRLAARRILASTAPSRHLVGTHV